MWLDEVFSTAERVASFVGGKEIFCALAAAFIFLFLRKVLFFTSAGATIIMFAVVGFFLFDHQYSYLISHYNTEIIVPVLWITEISLLIGVRMLGGCFMGRGLFSIPTQALLLSLALIAGNLFYPDLLAKYLPNSMQDNAYLVACGIPLAMASWRIISSLIPACVWGSVVALAIISVVNNTDVTNVSISLPDILGKNQVNASYQDGKRLVTSLLHQVGNGYF